MKGADFLIEFEKPGKMPWEFKFIIIAIPLIVSIYFYILFPSMKEIFFHEKILQWRTYYYFLILLYPSIGLQGYILTRKYGWFILSHYLLTSTIIFFFAGLYSLSEEEITLSKLLSYIAIISLNGVSLFIIQRRKILQLFNINKDNKILFILINIVVIIINALIWALS